MSGSCIWVRIGKLKVPCPVCGHRDWCSISSDDLLVFCTREKEGCIKSAKHGARGWIHLNPDKLATKAHTHLPDRTIKLSAGELTAMALEAARNHDGIRRLAKVLGVSFRSLRDLGVGWHEAGTHGWWTVPERDSQGGIIGVNRRFQDGRRYYVKGSKGGLIYNQKWGQGPGPVLLPEGASDVAAAVDMGLKAVGRPSNLAGISHLIKLFENDDRVIVVMGENDWRDPDQPHDNECECCPLCWPGRWGAMETARILAGEFCKNRKMGKNVLWALPPEGYKDIRDWFRKQGAGNERAAFDAGRRFLSGLTAYLGRGSGQVLDMRV